VLGRRNHFGSKSPRGTQVAGILYTLVESAKASGVDPIAYLTEVATRAKESSGAVLLPAEFSAERAAA
jgi:transposase